MQLDNIHFTAPQVFNEDFNEAEIFGSAIWLWLHSKTHNNFPLHTLSSLLLPALKHRQFILGVEKGKPIFFLTWATFSEEAEQRYINNPAICMPQEDWNSGNRIWFLDWVSPFGHSMEIANIMKKHIFPKACIRSLYHRGNEKGLRIITWHGTDLSPNEANEWFASHPIIKDNSNVKKTVKKDLT